MMNRKLPCAINTTTVQTRFLLFLFDYQIVIYYPLLPIQCTYLTFLFTMNLNC
ncbi:hypothetical protein BDN72DRAFT_848884 [Pluteus cervinus]|uniref:Uncharacterized protein n=1 Tax=Pluteus cervinus TaxID=181527 RepID=A0ACD3A8Q4_9AGAR|nr:hypothetical protein BDN72DRAFT_848884 [Pluteus cervinus]